jgi:hypothetical protein
VQKEFIYNNERMADYLVEVQRMEKFFTVSKSGMYHDLIIEMPII